MRRRIGRRVLTLSMVAMLTLSGAAVPGSTSSVQAATKKTQKITLEFKKDTMLVGGKRTLKATTKNVKTVVWKSSNKKIATVSKKGVVTAKKAGKVTITATAKGNKKVKASCKLTIQNRVDAKVTTKNPTVDDTINIQFIINGKDKSAFYYGEEPGTLEKYTNGKWVKLELKEGISWTDIAIMVRTGEKKTISINPGETFKGVTSGHYRYTKEISQKGKAYVKVEFDLAGVIEESQIITQIQPTEERTEEKTTQQSDADKKEETTAEKDTPKDGEVIGEDKVTAKVTGENLTIDNSVEIEFGITGNGNNTYYYGDQPGLLEKYENGEWVALKQNPEICYTCVAYQVCTGETKKMSFSPQMSFLDVTAGHYRYTYTLMGNAGLPIVVEFDLAEAKNEEVTTTQEEKDHPQYIEVTTQQNKPNTDQVVEATTQQGNTDEDKSTEETPKDDVFVGEDVVTAKVVNENLTVKDTVEIEFEITGNKENVYYNNTYPGTLEKYENGEWVELKEKDGMSYIDMVEEILVGQKKTLLICPSETYVNVTAGHYRYTKKMSGKTTLPVVVEFDLAEAN